MSASRSGGGPEDRETATWATETLPIAVRKELLERELNRLGFRKAGTQGGNAAAGASPTEPGEGGSSHPKADTSEDDSHAD
jgi:hypothetical protein